MYDRTTLSFLLSSLGTDFVNNGNLYMINIFLCYRCSQRSYSWSFHFHNCFKEDQFFNPSPRKLETNKATKKIGKKNII